MVTRRYALKLVFIRSQSVSQYLDFVTWRFVKWICGLDARLCTCSYFVRFKILNMSCKVFFLSVHVQVEFCIVCSSNSNMVLTQAKVINIASLANTSNMNKHG